MKTRFVPLLVSTLALSLTLSGCDKFGKKDAAPTGQVVATVNGTEITVADIRQEMGFIGDASKADAALNQAALDAVISRRLLSDAAMEEKLDNLPSTAVLQEKARQAVLVEALTRKLRASAPPVSREEAEQYVNEHPASFAQRRIFVVNQLIVPNGGADLAKAMEPLDTIEQIEALLNSRKIGFNRTVGTIDALSIDGGAAEKIAQLPGSAVFVSPEGSLIRVNHIRDVAIQPLTGEPAIKVAQELLSARRASNIVNNRVEDILKKGRANVKYNPQFVGKGKS